MDTVYEQSALQIRKLEEELKRLNLWSSEPIAPEKLVNMGAFGTQTMAFTEWLQFVLIPRVRSIIDEKGPFPSNSNVSGFAYREFDGWPEAEHLLKILSDFDALFN